MYASLRDVERDLNLFPPPPVACTHHPSSMALFVKTTTGSAEEGWMEVVCESCHIQGMAHGCEYIPLEVSTIPSLLQRGKDMWASLRQELQARHTHWNQAYGFFQESLSALPDGLVAFQAHLDQVFDTIFLALQVIHI